MKRLRAIVLPACGLLLSIACSNAANVATSAAKEGPTDAGFTAAMVVTAQQLMAQAFQKNESYALVRSLTTEVGPRLAGTAAEARARAWAQKKLVALGFQNVRIEPFAVPLWIRGAEQAEIIAPFPQPLDITALGGSASTGAQGIQAQVIRFDSLASLQQAAPQEVQGKIVFVDEVMARSKDGSGYADAVQKRLYTASTAQRLGAVAALIRSVGTSSHRFAHTGQMRVTDTDDGAIGVPIAALAAPDADQLSRALTYAQPLIVKMLLTPQHLPQAMSGNVIAELVGRDRPQDIVLVAAHLDSWDLGTGAVDDGAGVGIVTAAVQLLIEHLPQSPRRTIRVVLFGAEEVGTVGAKAYTVQHEKEIANHIAALESDFGSGDIWRIDSRVGAGSLEHVRAIATVLAPLGIVPGNNMARGGPDLKYLRSAGVPLIGLLQDGRAYFDVHHTANDTLDKIAPQDLDQNVAAYAALLYLLAETDADFR